LQSFCVPVLRILNQKNYEKCHNGRSGIYDQFAVAVAEERAGDGPNRHYRDGGDEGRRTAGPIGRRSSNAKTNSRSQTTSW
jgi:hypothetical protein